MSMKRLAGRVGTLLFVAYGLARYVYSGILQALDPHAWITVPEQLQPLMNLLWHGTPVRDSLHLLSDFLRYGPTFYLVSAPVIALTRNQDVIHYVLLALSHVFFLGALFLLDRRLFSSSHWTIRLLFFGTALNFTPALESLRGATLDIWELFAIAAAFYLYTSAMRRGREWAVVVISVNVMAKLMPLLVLLLLFLRGKIKAVLISAAVAIVIIIAGQVLFGPELGFGYPKRALYAMSEFGRGPYPLWWENDTPRGLIYKTVTGFKLAPGELYVRIDPGVRRAIDAVMSILGLALLVFSIIKLWRWPGPDDDKLRILGAFSTAIVLYHLISPYSTHQYLPSTIVAYAFVLVCALEGLLGRVQAVMALISLALIGNIAPKTVLVKLTAMQWLNDRFHSVPQYADHQMFTFYGLPGIGVILLGIVVLRLQWEVVRRPVV
jgi:hypothetical protein